MKNQDWSVAYGLVFGLVFAGFLVLGVLQSDRPLWQDESLLIDNFGLPWRAYFSALPFNDQAAPPLALITHDLMWRIAGEQVAQMRLLTLALTASFFAGVGFSAIRRQDIVMLIALVLLMTTTAVSVYSVEIKHYIFELCAALLLFHIAITTNPVRPRAATMLFGLSVVLSFFSFSAMFISVIIFLDMVVIRATGRMRFVWFAGLIGFVLTWVGLYVGLFKPITYFQLNNYPEAYELHTLLARLELGLDRLVRPLSLLFSPAYFGIALCGGVVVAWLVHRRNPDQLSLRIGAPDMLVIRLGFGLLGALMVLSLMGQYPLFSTRQLLFTQPAKALVAAAIVVFICRLARQTMSYKLAVPVLVVVLALPGTVNSVTRVLSGNYNFQDTRALFDHLKIRADVPVVANELFAPTLRYYLGKDPQAPLTVMGALPYVTREIDDTATVVANLNADAVKQLNTHLWSPLSAGETYGAFTDFVVRIAADEGHIIFAAVQFTNLQKDLLMRSVVSGGCEVAIDFEGAGAIAYDIRCAPRP